MHPHLVSYTDTQLPAYRLDFAKLSNTKPEEIAAAHLRSLLLSNLESLIESVATTTWVRKRRVDHVSSEAKNDLSPVAGVSAFGDEKVDLILNIQEREGGWDGLIDVGGMKRLVEVPFQPRRIADYVDFPLGCYSTF